MEGSDGSPPLSLGEIVRAAELFPKPILEKEDDKLAIPFTELPGESVKFLGRTDDGVLALSNYRLFLLKNSTNSETSVPLGLIETPQVRDLFHLIINCKDASTVKCSFSTSEQSSEWQRRITLSVGIPDKLESLFAFPFYAWTSEIQQITTATSTITTQQQLTQTIDNNLNEWTGRLRKNLNNDNDFLKEVKRLQFDLTNSWRISEVNNDFQLCPSYPRYILVPKTITDDILQIVASFRSSRRIPAVVWRHKRSGAVIARCSQPEVGWLGWRNSKDEQLLKALADSCDVDKPKKKQRTRQNSNASSDSPTSSPDNIVIGNNEEICLLEQKKILIVDARSYTSAVTNRARGGGCECAEYYPCAEIQFMNLGNIHAIRKSFHALRQLCASPPDIPNWLGLLERTMWLQHMSGLLTASMVVDHAIERQGRPVLVHCSDGWDRTPQIVATAQLCLDPHYRTVEGFRTLVEREWLSFGHKFADRCGHGPGSDEINERCPVFLQWLDCVHQIHRQFPCSFEFSMGYLIKLAQHSHSCLFGTFLCNTVKERNENTVFDRTFSVWHFLSGPIYKNPLYVPNKEKVLWPAHNVRDLTLWSEVYLGSLGNQNIADCLPNTNDSSNQESMSPMTKTRSYGDLLSAGGIQGGLTRRSSDPSMIMDSHILTPLNISSDNSIDSASDRAISPDIMEEVNIVTLMRDTRQKLQSLTQELNQSDEEIENKIERIQLNTIINTSNNLNHTDNKNINSSPFYYQQPQQQQQKHQEQEQSQHENNNSQQTTQKNQQKQQLQDDINISIDKNNESKQLIKETDDDGCCLVANETTLNCNFELNDDIRLVHNNIDVTDSKIICNKIIVNDNYVDDDDDFSTNDFMLQSVDLNDTSRGNSPQQQQQSSYSQNLWHGSVETSTDTLIPIEQYEQKNYENKQNNLLTDSIVDNCNTNIIESGTIIDNTIILNGTEQTNCDNYKENYKLSSTEIIIDDRIKMVQEQNHHIPPISRVRTISSYNQMDESILIQPEYEKLDINGKIDSNTNNNNTLNHHINNRRRRNSTNSKNNDLSPNKHFFNGSTSPSVTNSRFSTPGGRSLPLTPPGALDRPSVTISCPDGLAHALSEQNLRLQQIVYEHKLREEALQKELYATRLALLKKTCQQCSNNQFQNEDPDDLFVNDELNVALSTIRSRSLGRRSLSPQVGINCDWSGSINDSNIENASVCSWEDIRSGQSSGANSVQPNNDLWVPDHSVASCTGCHMVFWLGRRKHHCRSCGQIFCADCSEFRGSLPDKRLYATVRLCASCYNQERNFNQQTGITLPSLPTTISTYTTPQITSSSTSTITSSTSTTTPSSTYNNNNNINNNNKTLDQCKHSVCVGGGDRGFKATTAN